MGEKGILLPCKVLRVKKEDTSDDKIPVLTSSDFLTPFTKGVCNALFCINHYKYVGISTVAPFRYLQLHHTKK